MQKIIKIGQALIKIMKEDIFFSIGLFLALGSCVFHTPKFEYIDLKVLITLFNLMLIVKAFEHINLLDSIAVALLQRSGNSRKIFFVLLSACFFSAMFVTNDVALITFVPLTLIIGRKAHMKVGTVVILETIVANIGSVLTPMGNPQNLLLFSYYDLDIVQFLKVVAPLAIFGWLWVLLLNSREKKVQLSLDFSSILIKSKKQLFIWLALFVLVVLSILGFVNYWIAFLCVMVIALVLNKKLIAQVDYVLLATFLCFFIFIGNISNMETVQDFMRGYLGSETSVYIAAVLLSQLISNVPCAILLCNFTEHWQELLMGVNVGGMGTLIASLASLISYKLYIRENIWDRNNYLVRFSIYNFVSLVVFAVLDFFILHIV